MKALEKLDEARYFLAQVKSNIKDRRAFKHNLSAFLSAARSVTFVLQAEYDGNSKFDAWYSKKQEEMRSDPLLRFFVEKRNYVVKQSSIEPRAHVSVTIYETLTISDNVTVHVKRVDGTEKVISSPPEPEPEPKLEPRPTEVEYRWFFEDCKDKDVVTLAEEYLKKLTGIVEEAQAIVS